MGNGVGLEGAGEKAGTVPMRAGTICGSAWSRAGLAQGLPGTRNGRCFVPARMVTVAAFSPAPSRPRRSPSHASVVVSSAFGSCLTN